MDLVCVNSAGCSRLENVAGKPEVLAGCSRIQTIPRQIYGTAAIVCDHSILITFNARHHSIVKDVADICVTGYWWGRFCWRRWRLCRRYTGSRRWRLRGWGCGGRGWHAGSRSGYWGASIHGSSSRALKPSSAARAQSAQSVASIHGSSSRALKLTSDTRIHTTRPASIHGSSSRALKRRPGPLRPRPPEPLQSTARLQEH